MPDRLINIKDLVLEEPERARELPFDPEKEITEEDWREMLAALDLHRTDIEEEEPGALKVTGTEMWRSFVGFARAMQILSPVRIAETSSDEGLWRKVRDDLTFERRGDSVNFPEYATSVKLLFPERMKQYSIPRAWKEKILGAADQAAHEQKWGHFYYRALEAKILFPGHHISIPSEMRSLTQRALIALHEDRLWGSRVSFIIEAKIIGKEEINIRKEMWTKMSDQLQRLREEKQWEEFALLAANMKILAADEVYITPDGQISITMRKPKQNFTPQTPPMPEVRRF